MGVHKCCVSEQISTYFMSLFPKSSKSRSVADRNPHIDFAYSLISASEIAIVLVCIEFVTLYVANQSKFSM